MKKMLTIKELALKTGISQYEIRRRIRNGTLPHVKVGASQTKVLIDEDVFISLMAEESVNNMQAEQKISPPNINDNENTGYKKLRLIN